MNVRVSQARIDDFFLPERLKLPEAKGHSLAQTSKRTMSAIDKVLNGKKIEVEESVKKASEKDAAKAKAKAIEIYKKSRARKGKKKATKEPKRIVLEEHNLSESDDDD